MGCASHQGPHAPEELESPCVRGAESHGVEAESTADERVTDRKRNQVEAPAGRVGGRNAATHPLAAKPPMPKARGVRVKKPPGLGAARGVFVNKAAAKGGEPALR